MKQIILSIILLFTATAASAQQDNNGDFIKRLHEARLAEMALRLNLSDSQKDKFAPIYDEYCKEIFKTVTKIPGNRHGKKGGIRHNGKHQSPGYWNPTDAEKVQIMKDRMEKQKKIQDIRLKYADRFATVLSDKQLVDFYQVEDDIQQKMRQRATHPRGKKQ